MLAAVDLTSLYVNHEYESVPGCRDPRHGLSAKNTKRFVEVQTISQNVHYITCQLVSPSEQTVQSLSFQLWEEVLYNLAARALL